MWALEVTLVAFKSKRVFSETLTDMVIFMLFPFEKIKKGDIIGLDAVIDCTTSQIDDLIADLKNVTFEEAESKPAVTGNIIK